jgi:putative pyruvate formate lyase activating enzyme
MKPSYLKLFKEGILSERLEMLFEKMKSCNLCPRKCKVNRVEGERGVCRAGRKAIVASYNAHFGEEEPLVGTHGSGTIFLSSCNLMCSFCQNHDISHNMEGVEVEPDHLAAMMLNLAEMGCHNINLVTPTHFTPQILEGLISAVEDGFELPIVYNCGGYESLETLKFLNGIIDIYMPDFKFWDSRWSERFCNAPNYKEVAMEAIREMHDQVGDLILGEDGVATRGLLVRHLVMPNGVSGTKKIMEFLAKEISSETYVNVMDQYRPCYKAKEDKLIKRRLTSQEYRDAVNETRDAGITRLDNKVGPRLIFSI